MPGFSGTGTARRQENPRPRVTKATAPIRRRRTAMGDGMRPHPHPPRLRAQALALGRLGLVRGRRVAVLFDPLLEDLPDVDPGDRASTLEPALHAFAAARTHHLDLVAAGALALGEQAVIARGLDAAAVLAALGRRFLRRHELAAHKRRLGVGREGAELGRGRGALEDVGANRGRGRGVLVAIGGAAETAADERRERQEPEREQERRATHRRCLRRQCLNFRMRLNPRRTSPEAKPPAKSPPSIWSTVVARALPRLISNTCRPTALLQPTDQAATLELRSRLRGMYSAASRLLPRNGQVTPTGALKAFRRRGVSRTQDGATIRFQPRPKRRARRSCAKGRVRSSTSRCPDTSAPARSVTENGTRGAWRKNANRPATSKVSA